MLSMLMKVVKTPDRAVRADISVAAYCTAFGTESTDDDGDEP